MDIIKGNWKFIVFIVLSIYFLSILEQLSMNGRYVPSSDSGLIVDTRTGKIYKRMFDEKGNELVELKSNN